MLKRGQIYHLNSTPVPPVTFSLGHFSLQALERDSCTSKGAVQREREREVRKMAGKKRERETHRKQWLYLELVVHGGSDK